MKLSLRKKKIELTNYQKIMKEFKSDINADTTKKYSDIDKIYTEIKDYYTKKIKKEKFDIKIEKIRIEQNLGSFINNFTAYNMALYVAVFGSLFYFMIQTILSFIDAGNKIFDSAFSLIVLLGFLFFTTNEIDKSIQKDKPRNFMLNISLKVLEDIEKEEPKQIKQVEENQSTYNSATITAKQKLHEYSEKRHHKKK